MALQKVADFEKKDMLVGYAAPRLEASRWMRDPIYSDFRGALYVDAGEQDNDVWTFYIEGEGLDLREIEAAHAAQLMVEILTGKAARAEGKGKA